MKKILYIDVDEEVSSIHDRLKPLRHKEIYLVVPRKALLFQSSVNLKIIKNQLDEKGQKLILVTTDPNGRHQASRLGIEGIDSIETEPVTLPTEENPQMRIQPIQARRNEVLREAPRRVTEKKITIAELVKEFRVRSGKDKKESSESGDRLFRFGRPSRRLLAIILMVSAGLFMLISYIALPGATIYIRPKFNTITHTVNVTLADRHKNQTLLSQNKLHVVPSEEVETLTSQTKVFSTTSQEFQGVNARGDVRIMNASPDEWPLKGGTRFQTDDGLIFRTAESVYVPPAVTDETGKSTPGVLTVRIQADPFDLYGKPVGDRGNIPATRFILPGLSRDNQSLLWGESVAPMTGGFSKYRQVVMKEDIDAAKKQIEDNLILMAKDDLHTRIDELNQLNHTQLILLDDSDYLTTDLVEFKVADDLEGSARDKFEVFAKVKAKGIAYDSGMLFDMLKQELMTRTHPDMHIREESITPDLLTYEVISQDTDAGRIKLTVTIEGIEEYQIEEPDDAGVRFGKRIKEKVLGMDIAEAEKWISNSPEVDAVHIKTWPFWLSAMPRLPENIVIRRMPSD